MPEIKLSKKAIEFLEICRQSGLQGKVVEIPELEAGLIHTNGFKVKPSNQPANGLMEKVHPTQATTVFFEVDDVSRCKRAGLAGNQFHDLREQFPADLQTHVRRPFFLELLWVVNHTEWGITLGSRPWDIFEDCLWLGGKRHHLFGGLGYLYAVDEKLCYSHAAPRIVVELPKE